MFNVRMFGNIRKFGCSMFECSLMFECSMFECSVMFGNVRLFESSNVRMFAKIRMFACSMFECSLIFFSNPCSRVRMFVEHERTFEHWTQMFNVRWPLQGSSYPQDWEFYEILNRFYTPHRGFQLQQVWVWEHFRFDQFRDLLRPFSRFFVYVVLHFDTENLEITNWLI